MINSQPLKALTDWRVSAGYSRQDVADLFDVSPVTVWRWEAGERRPSRQYLVPLSEKLGVPVTVILGL